MIEYHEALEHILKNGTDVSDRTGVGTRCVFGYQMRFDLRQGFPAVTSKRLAWKAVVGELLWFLEGSTDERRLAEITYEKPREGLIGKTTIWTANADAQGKELGYVNNDLYKELGPIYGFQWRNFDADYSNNSSVKSGKDQIRQIIRDILTNEDSRRLILTSWNPNQTDIMALPPCHTLIQFRVINGRLSCQLYQRSADMFLGVPFNIASYSLLTHILAKICGLEVGDFVWTGGDCHIYNNHMEQVRTQLTRKVKILPHLKMPDIRNLEGVLDTKPSQYKLLGYEPHETIKAPMAV